MGNTAFTKDDVCKVSQLAAIPVSQEETEILAKGFTQTMNVIGILSDIQTTNIEPTSQVTGLENVLREDTIDSSHSLTQEEALANAKRTHNGFFVVSRVLDQTIKP